MRIGVDVGGTNTDAVVLDERLHLIGAAKVPTTEDLQSGIREALAEVLRSAGVLAGDIKVVALGTTHCTNAVLERRKLGQVAVVRLGRPAALAVEPLATWPEDLLRVVGSERFIIHGGYEWDGRLIDRDVDVQELAAVADRLRRSGVREVAVTGVFAPTRPDQETFVEGYLTAAVPGVRCTLSHKIGSLGLLERENSAVLNGALRQVAVEAVDGLSAALVSLRMSPAVYFAQNDGTLMGLDYAKRYPIVTIGSGPTNSLRGAAWLSGAQDAIVVDVGGTSTDVGILQRGYPRQSAVAVEIGGVRTNFRMPDIVSIAVGGGSHVTLEPQLRIGPQSVGYQLRREAVAFGGERLTATDVAIAVMGIKIEGAEPEHLALYDPAALKRAQMGIVQLVEEAIDRIKTSAEDVPVVLVGGGSVLLPDRLSGASRVVRPPHHQHANAIGAAIGEIGAQVERIVHLAGRSQDEIIAQVSEEARREVQQAGGDPHSAYMVDMEIVPLTYLGSDSARVHVKLAAPLRL